MYDHSLLREDGVLRRTARRDDVEVTSGPRTPSEGFLQRLQRLAGNRATTQLVQTKLRVGAVDDPLEHEADRTASRVVAALRRSPVEVEERTVSTTAAEDVARAPASAEAAIVGHDGGDAPASAVEALNGGGGQPLPDHVQRQAGAALGADLSGVRIHTGPASQRAATDLGATAFTRGRDIHFAAGAYDPSSASGQQVLGHELTHTVQQGGAAVQRQTIRRMPSPAAVKARTGRDRKEGRKVFGKTVGATTTYNALLDGIQAHSSYILNTEVSKDPKVVMTQIQTIHRYIEFVEAAAKAYLDKGNGDAETTALCAELLASVPLEKKVVVDVGARWARTPHRIGNLANPKWYLVLPTDPRTYTPAASDNAASEAKTVAGGKVLGGKLKQVTESTNARGETGFFAADNAGEASRDKMGDERTTLGDYGFVGEEVRLEERAIAMSRLDKLLKAGVIARTERAILDGKTKGTWQEGAKGTSLDVAIESSEDLDDGDLARLLSRLQLVDAIAGQIDRHEGNYYVLRDPQTGRIVGVTGIDLDLAWVGKNDNTSKTFSIEEGARKGKKNLRADPFPGFSRYVDRELAETIMALKDDDLRVILMDLLEPPLIDAALDRLHELQALLRSLGPENLLAPDEWTKAVRAKIIAERHIGEPGEFGAKSYYGRVHAKVEAQKERERQGD